MTDTLDQDVTMSERAMRVEAHFVDGPEGGLAYVVMYTTDTRGQWALVTDWTFDAFAGSDDRAECLSHLSGWLTHMLRP